MIQLFLQKFKESTLSILAIALFLTGVGLITLKSISTGHEGNYFQQSFYKQLFFLLPALFAYLIAFFVPRHTIHRYIYGLYVFMILLILYHFWAKKLPLPIAGSGLVCHLVFSLLNLPSGSW